MEKGVKMGFSVEKQEQIKRYMLEKISEKGDGIVKKVAENYNISLNTVYRYIKELEQENIIRKVHNNKYELVSLNDIFSFMRDKQELESEDIIYQRYIKNRVLTLPDNVQRIWEYSFMEMMNNAIDHSMAEKVSVIIEQNYMDTKILIVDNGIGIFRKIQEYYAYSTLDQAVNELFKGKLTTDSINHSGEGIFFTSRVLDGFVAISDGKIFSHDKYSEMMNDLDNISDLRKWKNSKGTIIFMKLSNFSNKSIGEVFDMFSDVDGGFTKTNIPIKQIYETYPVSRSQAKRLCNRFEKFQTVELDFSGIEEIGQGFAHEIFMVFQKAHENVNIVPLNMSERVEKMINHVKKTVI